MDRTSAKQASPVGNADTLAFAGFLLGQRAGRLTRAGETIPLRGGSLAYYNWFAYEFWRFVFVQQEIAKYAQTFLEFPPMQKGATFNLAALKEELEKKMEMLKSRLSQ